MDNHIGAISKTVRKKYRYTKWNMCMLYSLNCTLHVVLPYMNYGILIWGNTCKPYLDEKF